MLILGVVADGISGEIVVTGTIFEIPLFSQGSNTNAKREKNTREREEALGHEQ